jgi:lysyl-tRNA synthetase class 2
MEESSELIRQRVRKIEELKNQGIDPYPNDFRVTHTTENVLETYGTLSDEKLRELEKIFSIGGRIVAIRDFGKASFIQIQDRKGRMQAYVRKDIVGDQAFEMFKTFDIGDIVGLTGKIFRTKTKELTLEVRNIRLLTKSLRPLPEKWHGLTDIEARYRHRYLDLIANPRAKEIFLTRIKAIQMIREFFKSRGYLEVETPMMQPIPGGATAKPFKTYHNALNMELYLRVAPELYLKRLVIGGLERIFEINRSFRNEGISTYHNPEFTMLEFYESYATYEDMMVLTEELCCSMIREFRGGLKTTHQGLEIDFAPSWRRIPFQEALVKIGHLDPAVLRDSMLTREAAKKAGLQPEPGKSHEKILDELFKNLVEPHLQQPTFVIHYPTEISPLARRNRDHPEVVDRFELFVAGREIANGFSELNDPVEQRERFARQLRERGGEDDGPLLHIDEDFLQALETGMPPTAGEGIGIDRWVMLLADAPSIRDVILFPLLRPERC